jgi:hypothetical protein
MMARISEAISRRMRHLYTRTPARLMDATAATGGEEEGRRGGARAVPAAARGCLAGAARSSVRQGWVPHAQKSSRQRKKAGCGAAHLGAMLAPEASSTASHVGSDEPPIPLGMQMPGPPFPPC